MSFFLLLSQLFLRVLGVVFNVGEYFLRDVVVLLNHDCSDFLDVILTPPYFLLIILRKCLTLNYINSFYDIFGDLAVTSCFS
jgi:hypothetical protein